MTINYYHIGSAPLGFTMLTLTLIYLLFSNAMTLRRDKSILLSRTTITILAYSVFFIFFQLFFLEDAIGLFGGLFHVTSNTHVFHGFVFILSILILTLTGFYPRKV